MKFLVSFILTGILAYTMGLFLPWWSVSIAGLLSGLSIPQKRLLALFSSFLAIFIFWSGIAMYISYANDHILARKISMLVLKKDAPILLILISGTIGGFVAGISAITGRSLVILFSKN